MAMVWTEGSRISWRGSRETVRRKQSHGPPRKK